MNRTGLFIALGLFLVVGLLFGLYPELDLKLAAAFYDVLPWWGNMLLAHLARLLAGDRS